MYPKFVATSSSVCLNVVSRLMRFKNEKNVTNRFGGQMKVGVGVNLQRAVSGPHDPCSHVE